jgi:hypothetical protein
VGDLKGTPVYDWLQKAWAAKVEVPSLVTSLAKDVMECKAFLLFYFSFKYNVKMEMTLQMVRIGSNNLEIWIGCKRMVTQAGRVV